MSKINVFWHRRDLRVDDNPGLYYALRSEFPVLPIFIFDKKILSKLPKNDARVSFIYDEVSRLGEVYSAHESTIRIFDSTPIEAFEALLKEFEIGAVYTNRDYEPYALQRDQEVDTLLSRKNIPLLSFKDHVIFEREEILTDSGHPYKVFTPYKKKWLDKLSMIKIDQFDSQNQFSGLLRTKPYPFLKLSEMGFVRSGISIPDNKINKSIISNYHTTRNFPAQIGTTRLGIHLRFGTLSIRTVLLAALGISETWVNELIWREFYQMILSNFPCVVDKAFKPAYDQIPWSKNEQHFERWKLGMTGYPIVDAGMRELNETGYMHNRVRMITASFLTKHLLIDWRWGEAYFAEKLLDFELASNNGGWQWAAGTGTDAQPYFRVFNPKSQQEKFDPAFEYIRRWVPEFGTDQYPYPIVDHKEARLKAINTYKEALA